MEALRAITRDLLRCGASIQEINAVRKHLSAIQGGRLAAVCKGEALALIISDVAGDDPTHIASGPLSPDPTTFGDALGVLKRYRIGSPGEVLTHLQRGSQGEVEETPKPGDAAFARVENRVIATAQQSLQAAAQFFRDEGIPAVVLGDTVTGEAREVARVFASLARQIRRYGEPWRAPVALLSGGELTVTVRGRGRGGRCSAFLLALAIELEGMEGVHALACDTDGIDGTEGNAGAVLCPETLARAKGLGLSAGDLLSANDSFTFFEHLGDLVMTGPTRTNVNDYRVVLVT